MYLQFNRLVYGIKWENTSCEWQHILIMKFSELMVIIIQYIDYAQWFIFLSYRFVYTLAISGCM